MNPQKIYRQTLEHKMLCQNGHKINSKIVQKILMVEENFFCSIFNWNHFFQVPTLVQLLKDIDNPGEIMEYVQPYIGSVSKAKDFANDFLAKRNQLIHAEVD